MTTRDNVALFHARALRDYCKDHTICMSCVFYNNELTCELMRQLPEFWDNIERRDNNND